jgi:hypothetical protein
MNFTFVILVSFILLISGNVFQSHSAGTRHLIAGSTDSQDHINIVFLSEGFTESEQTSFLSCCRTFTDTIFSHPPYHQYRSLFNVWGIFIASAESGTDHSGDGIYKDTYFGSYFSAVYERFVDLSNDGKTKVYELLAQHVPDYDMVCVIVNDKTYGGTGGPIAVVTTNASAPVSTIHEFGHSFFNLADEYEESYSLSPCEMPNVTADTIRKSVKWNVWIDSATPLPTPPGPQYSKSVGLFEGAMYQIAGWYRPMLNCMMRSLNYAFCKVCLETHIAKLYEVLSPVIGSFPETDTCSFSGGNDLLAITTILVDPGTIMVQWKVNGVSINKDSDTLRLKNVTLQKGSNRIMAIVKDTTGAVRIPENLGLLKDSVNWVVDYNPTKNSQNGTILENRTPEIIIEHGTLQVLWTSDFSIKLVSLTGVSFMRQQCNERYILNTRTVSPGVYILSLQNRWVRKTIRVLLK